MREWPALVMGPRRCVSPELYRGARGRDRLRADARGGGARLVDGGEEGGGGDGADAGDRAQARHRGILDGEVSGSWRRSTLSAWF